MQYRRRLTPELISQLEMEICLALQNRARTLRRIQLKHKAKLFNRMLAGATVEPGVHVACVVTSNSAGRLKKTIKIR